jgi:hypothetical protein
VRQPALRLALPHQPEARRADDDRGERVVGLDRRQRLDGLAQAGLVGQEGAPRLQEVAHAGPLERRQLAAGESRGGIERLAGSGARTTDGLDRVVVLGAQAGEHGLSGRGHRDAVHAKELLERLQRPRIDRQRAATALHPWERQERLAGVVVPQHLEREARLLDGVLDDELGRRRLQPDAQTQSGRARSAVQPRAGEVGEQLGHVGRERQDRPAVP